MKIPSRSIIVFVLALGVMVGVFPGAAGAEEGSLAMARVNLVHGMRAYNTGQYQEAVERLEKAVAADPESGTAYAWLGFARLALGQREEAEQALERALAAENSPPLPRQIEAALAEIRRGEDPREHLRGPSAAPGILTLLEQPRYEFRAGVTATDDSNPLLIPDGSLAVLPDGTVLLDTPSDTVLNLEARLGLYPFYDRGGWSLGLVFEGDQVLYQDFDFQDLTQLRAAVHLARGSDPQGYLAGPLGFTRVPAAGGKGTASGRMAWVLQGAYTDRRIDGDDLETLTQLGLGLILRESVRTATRIDFLYTDRDVSALFAGGDEADGTEWSAQAGQFFYFGRQDRYVRIFGGVGERDAGVAFDRSSVEVGADAALPFGERWALQLGVARREVEYDALESNPLFLFLPVEAARDDTLDRWTLALIWSPTAHLRLTGRFSHLERDAEFGMFTSLFPLDYERDGISLGVTWLF